MATGVFRGEGAAAAEAARRKKKEEEERLARELANVDWAGLGRLTGTGPRPAGPPAPVRGGRGNAVNTVGQSSAVGRPGATTSSTTGPPAPVGGGRGNAVNTVGQPSSLGRPGSSTSSNRTSGGTISPRASADTLEAQGVQRATGVPWLPGSFVGGPDRALANGGGVVDGIYIPPGTQFSPSLPLRPPTVIPGSGDGGGETIVVNPDGFELPGRTDSAGTPLDSATGTPLDSATGTPVPNVDQTSQMYADALAELQRQYGVSQENILASIGRMREDPYNMANAYAQMQFADPRVAANPVAEYMAAAGMAPGQAGAAQQMAQAEADAYLRAMQNVQNVLSTSQQQANASRMADIGLIETGATQDLESNLNMLRLGLERERIGAVTGLQQRNLENSLQMRNAIAQQISSIFSGQDVAPESILKLIEAALAKINTNQWTSFPTMGV